MARGALLACDLRLKPLAEQMQASSDISRPSKAVLCCTQCWSAPSGEGSCSVDGTTFGKLAAFVDSQTHFTVDFRSAHSDVIMDLCRNVSVLHIASRTSAATNAFGGKMQNFVTMLCRLAIPLNMCACCAMAQWVQILDILQEAGLGDDFALRMCEELLLPSEPHVATDDGDQDKKACDADVSIISVAFR